MPISWKIRTPHPLVPPGFSYADTSGPILTKSTGFMDAYDYTLNPYSGCSFGCSYCYAAFFSPDVDKRDSWGQWVTVKTNAVSKLSNMETSLDGKLIYMSSVTDPYQPIERRLNLTRNLVEVLAEPYHRPKLVVQTRSPDVTDHVDLFQKIDKKRRSRSSQHDCHYRR